jgi:hypothetical protein
MPQMVTAAPGGPKMFSAPPDSLYSIYPTTRDQTLAPQTGGLVQNPQIFRPEPSTFEQSSRLRSQPNNILFKSTLSTIPTTAGEVTTFRDDSKFINYVIGNHTSAQQRPEIGTVTLNSTRGQVNMRNVPSALGLTSAPLKTNPFAIPSFSVKN